MTKNHIMSAHGTKTIATVVTALAFSLAPAGSAFATHGSPAPSTSVTIATTTPSDVLSGTPWETTGAVDQDGNNVELTDENVADFVGWAYYDTDGTFTMYNLDDTPKMQGDWTVSADGTERVLVAKDADGEVLFERAVPITNLEPEEFTYRIVPDEAQPEVFYDIIHTPTDHSEPAAPTPDNNDAESNDEELADTAGVSPLAITAGAVVLLGGATVYITSRVRRGNKA